MRDVFRLGKPPKPPSSEGSPRPCPVLVKLSTPWDCKLILLRKRNLRGFKIPCLFAWRCASRSQTSFSSIRSFFLCCWKEQCGFLVAGESASPSLPLSTANQVTEVSGPPSFLDSAHALSPVTSSCSSSPAIFQHSSIRLFRDKLILLNGSATVLYI